jgi:tetratricopeptide (TPR) repeat protein
MIDYAQGRLQEALHDFRVALEFWDDVQEPIGTSYCLRYLRQVALMIDASSAEYLEACEKILDTLAISRASDDAWGTGTTLNHLGVLDTLQDELSSAAAYFREAAGLFQRIGDPYSLSQSYTYLGSVLARQGDIAEAHHAYVRGFESAREAESYPYMLESLLGLAWLSQATADLDVLWVLANLAIEHPATMFETRVSATELRQLLVERVSDGVVAATQVNRAVLTLEQIAQHLSQSGGSG